MPCLLCRELPEQYHTEVPALIEKKASKIAGLVKVGLRCLYFSPGEKMRLGQVVAALIKVGAAFQPPERRRLMVYKGAQRENQCQGPLYPSVARLAVDERPAPDTVYSLQR